MIQTRLLTLLPPGAKNASSWRFFSTSQFSSNERGSEWCRRLWNKSSNTERNRVDMFYSSSSSSLHLTELSSSTYNRKRDTLIEEIATVMRSGKGVLPNVLVDSVWDMYELILPVEVRKDMHRYLGPVHINRFFDFLSTMTELDLNVSEVQTASRELNEALRRYSYLEQEFASHSNVQTNTNLTTEPSHSDAQYQLQSKMIAARSKITMLCLKVSSAGSPFYYAWLKQTSSFANGVRRLIDLRKSILFFDKECTKRIATLKRNHSNNPSDQAQAQDLKDESDELEFWIQRKRDIDIIDSVLAYILNDFFAKEWLVMEELSWHTTPPAMLEQVMRAEVVHPFDHGLEAMKERIQPTPYRHAFTFLHPAVVEEPLISVQVALTNGIARSVDFILNRPSPLSSPENRTEASKWYKDNCERNCTEHSSDDKDGETRFTDVDTAIFYSINSSQNSLRGMDMGNFLIKRVVRDIEENLNAIRRARKLNPITTFSTLSPIPGYVRWLSAEVEKLKQLSRKETNEECASESPNHSEPRGKFLDPHIFGLIQDEIAERKYYSPLRQAVMAHIEKYPEGAEEALIRDTIEKNQKAKNLLAANAVTMQFIVCLFLAPDLANPWWNDLEFVQVLEAPLLRSVAHYLCVEKQRTRILDSVGHFHVSNGATVHQLNFLANCTGKGSRESGCVMVNYLYNMERVSENIRKYELHRTVDLSENVLGILNIPKEGGEKLN